MASLVLGAIGTSLGGSFLPGFLGLSGAAIGGLLGSVAGSAIDSMLFGAPPAGQSSGQRLDSLQVTSATEGAVIPRVFGRMRIGGNVIWATDFKETVIPLESGYGKGGSGGVSSSTYLYSASFAIAICEGEIGGVFRVWADGKPVDLAQVTMRAYLGSETQDADPLIASLMGADATPAYRGVAYAVFEDMALGEYGNRIPQLTFEVVAPIAAEGAAEELIEAVALLPGTGEFTLATDLTLSGGLLANAVADSERSDLLLSLDLLESAAPSVAGVSVIASWFGDDLRAGECKVRPLAQGATGSDLWEVNGVWNRAGATVSQDAEGNPHYGGTPADFAVQQAVQELAARGKKVTFVPFVLMDIPDTNVLPNPYSDNAATTGQPAHPWRGRITCSPAPGYAGSVDKTATCETQIDDFFGTATASQFLVGAGPRYDPCASSFDPGDDFATIAWSGDAPAAVAGQQWQIWQETDRAVVTVTVNSATTGEGGSKAWQVTPKIAWSSQVVRAALVGGDDINVIWKGVPSAWGYRRMVLHYAHLLAAAGGVDAFLLGSELRGLTWLRGAAGNYRAVEHLVDLAGEVRGILGSGTEISYAADWTEYFGHQPADGSGDVFFHLDPLWADADIDFVGIDNYMPLADWRDGFEHLDAAAGVNSTYDKTYLQGNIEGGEGYDWYYADAGARAAQTRTAIADGAYGKPWVFRYKDIRNWWASAHHDRPAGVESGTPTAWVPQSKPIVFTEAGCGAVDRGANQPNAFSDPKSSESALPYFSRGGRDDAMQRAFIEALWGYWADGANNPVSSVYGAPMVRLADCAAWAWDARPWPWFPGLTDLWNDGDNWRTGHWLCGRLGAVSLAALVAALCRRAGLADADFDVSGLRGAVEGYAIAQLESPRTSIAMLARHFGFDPVESEGVIRFAMRGGAPAATLGADDLATSGEEAGGEDFELTRGQESELPHAIKWQVAHADGEYQAVEVEARRLTGASERVSLETFPMAVPPEEAERRARRALAEAWAGREGATFRLPPSRLALDPTDAVTLSAPGRAVPLRIVSVADTEARAIEAVQVDREVYDAISGIAFAGGLSGTTIHGAATPVFMNLPWLLAAQDPVRPILAVTSTPWPGALSLWRAVPAAVPEWSAVLEIDNASAMGTLAADLPAGPADRWDRGSVLDISMSGTTLTSATDTALFAGANTFAVEAQAGQWEIVQGADVELVASGHYRLSRLLRGRRDTGWATGDPAPAGARVVRLDASPRQVPLTLEQIGTDYLWRVGPAEYPVSHVTMVETAFTPSGAGLVPFAPCDLSLGRDSASGALELTWKRRDRHPGADSWVLAEVPMSEETETYDIEVLSLDGASVLRTVSRSGTTSVTYSAAAQTADYGAPVSTIRVRIYQNGTLGRGHPAEATLSARRAT